MNSPPLSSSPLVETPFLDRLAEFLRRARGTLPVAWLGVLDFADAPDGYLSPTWLAWAPAPAPFPPSEVAARALAQGTPVADLSSLLPEDTQGARILPLTTDPPSPAPVLLWGAAHPIDPSIMHDLCNILVEGLSQWRQRQLADRVFAAVQALPDPFEITDRGHRMVYANPSWRTTFGHDPVARYSERTTTVLGPTPQGAPSSFLSSALKDRQAWFGPMELRTADQESRLCEVHIAPFRSAGFDGHAAVRRDLTHREGRERALAVAHQEFRDVMSALPDGVVVLRASTISFANPSFLDMVGRDAAEVLGHGYTHFVHSEDRDQFEAGRVGHIVRVRLTRPDGRPRIAEITTAGAVSFEGHPSTILVSRDITDDRIAADMLARAERLAALGSLAAGLAHEINNPLAYLVLNLHTFREDHREMLPDTGRHTLDEAIEGAERVGRIVTDLRNFSGSDPAEANEILEIVDVTSAVTSALNIAHNELRHRAEVAHELAPGARALAREGPLVQVLVSVLVNAAQAIPEGRASANRIAVRSRLRDSQVVISVSDTGVGIPRDKLDQVFDPFFTSKPRTEGSGLGLSIARRLIEGFDGTIKIASQVGEGTTVAISLPQVGGEPSRTPARRTEHPRRRVLKRSRILVIDDEAQIVRALVRMLRSHDVVPAYDYAEALHAIEASPDFDVVLCDLMMPGHSGPDLFRAAVARAPGLRRRFLFMTGGAFSSGILDFLKTWPLPIVEKPFNRPELGALIADVSSGRFDTA